MVYLIHTLKKEWDTILVTQPHDGDFSSVLQRFTPSAIIKETEMPYTRPHLWTIFNRIIYVSGGFTQYFLNRLYNTTYWQKLSKHPIGICVHIRDFPEECFTNHIDHVKKILAQHAKRRLWDGKTPITINKPVDNNISIYIDPLTI